jgi:23S rRNA (guanosine2251-2'-O)-methyltransferase
MTRGRSRGPGPDARRSQKRGDRRRARDRATPEKVPAETAARARQLDKTRERDDDRARTARSALPRASAGRLVLYGTHAVRELLRCQRRRIFGCFATLEAADRLAAEISGAGLVAHIVGPRDLTQRLGPGAVHQGVMVEVGPLPKIDLDEIEPRSGIVLVLDQITDPHNVGAILRTAAAFGVDGLVTTERHSPELSGLVAKAASGGLEHVPVVAVVNLARALEKLAELGFLRIGLDSQGPASLAEIDLHGPIALVLGGEGKGLRRLTRERCDILARLDMPGAIKSLNVSNACAVALSLLHSRRAQR